MDKKTVYEKAEQAINQAFDTAKHSVKLLSEKAGEAAHMTKLLIEKATLEHKVSRKFASLGNLVYEKASKGSVDSISLTEKNIKGLIEETRQLDGELSKVEKEIEKERKGKK